MILLIKEIFLIEILEHVHVKLNFVSCIFNPVNSISNHRCDFVMLSIE